MRRHWLARSLLALVLGSALLAGLNELLSFPLAFRAGDWQEWLGSGQAGPQQVRVYRLLEEKPTRLEAPFASEAEALLSEGRVLGVGSPYFPTATLGVHRHWESNRPVLLAPAPSVVSYQLRIPPAAVLTFGYGLKSRIEEELQNGARFVVEWESGGERRQLFEDEIVPARPGFWERSKRRERLWFRYIHPRLVKRGDLFREAEVPLDSLAGQEGELHFITTISSRLSECDYALSMWASPELWRGAEPEEELPVNVLFFMIEATPARMVEPYASAPSITPHLRRFAAQAAVFDKFFTVGDSTQLSTFSFFTGRHYRSMGLPNEIYYLAPLVKARFYRGRFFTLAEAFSRAGYRTAEFGTNHYFVPTREFGLDLGFDQLEILGRRNWAPFDTTLAALAWLRQNAGRPFFLYVHYDAPHDEENPDLIDLVRAWGTGGADRRWRYRKYLAQVMRADKDFGRFLEALDSLGVRDRTLIVVSADHGNCVLPGHTFAVLRSDRRPWWTPFQHGRAMSAEDIHVPLMMAGPGVAGGRRISTPLASIDLFPTIVDLALPHLSHTSQERMKELEGKSFAPLVRGEEKNDPPGRSLIYSISQGGESLVVDGRWHYVRRARGFDRLLFPGARELVVVKERLYDLAEDPEEEKDLAPEQPELLAAMRARLREARPQEPLMSLLYFNYEKGKVRGMLGLDESRGRISQAITFPPERPAIRLVPAEAGQGSLPGGEKAYLFEIELKGPTGLMLEDSVKWAEVEIDSSPLAETDFRLGPFGLPLLRGSSCVNPPPISLGTASAPGVGRILLEDCPLLSPPFLLARWHPLFYINVPGMYFYKMNFSDFAAETFSDAELSPAVKSLLRQWGYIE